MKLPFAHLALAFGLAVAVRAADALPVFNATLTVGKDHRFVLVDSTGKASSFLSIGETFAGYKLKSYDAKSGALEVERDGQVSRLTITTDAAVAHGAAAPTKATVADAEAVLNKMHFEEMMERTLAGQKKILTSQFQRMGQQMAAQGADPADAAAFQQKIMDEVSKMLDPKQLKTDISKVYSEVFSKEELDQISSFYSTPLGEMLAKKQPEVQEKFGAVMQTRMMDFMPRVQKLGAEFGAQQKAKRAAAAGNAAAPNAPAPSAPATAPKQ